MKNVLALLLALLISNFASAQKKEKITITAGDAEEVTYEEFADFDVKLSNTSGKQIDVSVLDPETRKQVSGYGLGGYGKTEMTIRDGHILRLKNNSAKEVSITLTFIEKRPVISDNAPRINFTLRNNSTKSIPLIIPDVMNPNLSPLSNSGVSLRVGQKIFYKKGLKKILILTVDESIKEGDKIDVAKLIKNIND